jgi:hypothetical protein
MHNFTTDETYRAQKIANERNLIRFRKAVSQARSPNELKLARFRLREQEEIALELNLAYPRGSIPERVNG